MTIPDHTPSEVSADTGLRTRLVEATSEALKPASLKAALIALWGQDVEYVNVHLNEMLEGAILDAVVSRVAPLLAERDAENATLRHRLEQAQEKASAERDSLRAEVERLKREGSPGVVHEVDQAFHDLAIRQRDHAWVQVERLQRENAALRAQANPARAEASRPAPDDAVNERDAAEEWADRLAYAIASVDVIGEHSSINNPWANALRVLSLLVTEPTFAVDKQTNPSPTKMSGTKPQGFPASPAQTNPSQSTVDAIACASVSPGAAVPCCGRHLPDEGGMWKHQSADGSLTWIDLTHPAGPVWDTGDPEPDPRPFVVMTPDGQEWSYSEDAGGWVLRLRNGVQSPCPWSHLSKPVVQVLPAHLRPLGEYPR